MYEKLRSSTPCSSPRFWPWTQKFWLTTFLKICYFHAKFEIFLTRLPKMSQKSYNRKNIDSDELTPEASPSSLVKRPFGNTFSLSSCRGVWTNKTLVALGTFGFGIPPAHPAKAKPKNRNNWPEAANLVQTLELLFEPSNAALLQPIIPKHNFPDSFFYHFPPPKHPTGTFRKEETVIKSNQETLM